MTDRAVLPAPPAAGRPPAGGLSARLPADPPPAGLAAVERDDLSPAEVHAVSAALGPDLCLVGCPPGLDRPAFAAAVATEAVRRGERVAVLTAGPADADAVFARLDGVVKVGRAVAPGESPAAGGADTFTADLDRARRPMADRVGQAESRLRQAKATADALPRPDALSARLAELSAAESADPLAHPDADRDAELAALDAAHAAEASKPAGLLNTVKGLFARPDADKQAAREAAHAQARQAVIDAAAGRRRAELARQRQAVEAETAAAAAAGLAVVSAEADLAKAAAALAKFDADRPRMDRQLWDGVPAVVGPATAHADPLLGGRFDRVVVLAADALDDAALEHACSLAGRWVLCGAEPRGRTRTPRAALFRRLWDRFARPPVWHDHGGRLVAVLAPHEPADTTGEPLADRPDVDLRFDPRGQLVAVLFAPTVPLAEAKRLLAAELGHRSPAGYGSIRWHDAADRLEASWPAAGPGGDWIDLGDGVEERVIGTGADGHTAAVRFAKPRWTRPAAEAWLNDHLPPVRAVRLPAPVQLAGR